MQRETYRAAYEIASLQKAANAYRTAYPELKHMSAGKLSKHSVEFFKEKNSRVRPSPSVCGEYAKHVATISRHRQNLARIHDSLMNNIVLRNEDAGIDLMKFTLTRVQSKYDTLSKNKLVNLNITTMTIAPLWLLDKDSLVPIVSALRDYERYVAGGPHLEKMRPDPVKACATIPVPYTYVSSVWNNGIAVLDGQRELVVLTAWDQKSELLAQRGITSYIVWGFEVMKTDRAIIEIKEYRGMKFGNTAVTAWGVDYPKCLAAMERAIRKASINNLESGK